MFKINKKIILIILLCIFLLLTSCGGEAEPHEILGKWQNESERMDGPVVRGGVTVTTYEFRSDGTGLFITQGWHYIAPEMERVEEDEQALEFTWNTPQGGFLIMHKNHGSPPDASYEIIANEQSAEVLRMAWDWSGLGGEEINWQEFERISGEPGELYGEWLNAIDGIRYSSYEFFSGGTGINRTIYYIDGSEPVENVLNIIWSADNGYLTMSLIVEWAFDYSIEGDTLMFMEMEFTRLEDLQEK
jgi:hypothetical protein